jgi:hypothetical protein
MTRQKKMLQRASYSSKHDNVGLAQYKLIHQFKEGGFPDATFASGTTQALFLGEFLCADSSIPSNFTVFAFHEQDPNHANQETGFLICHLIQKQGQKKFLDEIKASLKQSSARIFQLFCQPQNTTPTICSGIKHLLWG